MKKVLKVLVLIAAAVLCILGIRKLAVLNWHRKLADRIRNLR
jgi:hypothetical protein